MAWNAGYVTDVSYTSGYYTELNPRRAAYAVRNEGFNPPKVKHACELGFGQGLSIAIHAAAQPETLWWGTDFNPSQLLHARELIDAAGVDARLYEQSFEEFCGRDDLPEFDFIGLHGIWTWVSDANRHIIVDFVRRKLAPGGMLYISYNTLPGWSQMAPIRHIIREHADQLGAPMAPTIEKFDQALTFIDKLLEVSPATARFSPLLTERYKGLKSINRRYAVHEYLDRDWKPMYSAELADWLEPTKTRYTAPANPLERHDAIHLTVEQLQYFNTLPSGRMKETVRDYLTNQQFRRDIWCRGVSAATPLEQLAKLRDLRFILGVPRADVAMKVSGLQGDVDLQADIYDPVLDAMSDQQIHDFASIEAACRGKLTVSQIVSVLSVLCGMNALFVVGSKEEIKKAKAATDGLNRKIIELSKAAEDIQHLASPVTGAGHAVSRFNQFFIASIQAGRRTPLEWAADAWQILQSQGQRLVREGAAIEDPSENIALFQEFAETFQKQLPILKALQIV